MDEQVAEQSKTSSEGIEHGSVPQEGAVVQTQQTARLEEGSDSSTPNTNHTDAAAEVETSSQSIKACGVPEEGTVDVRSQPAPKVEEVDDPSTVKPVDHSAEVETPSQGTDGVKLQPAPKVEEDDDTSSAKPVDDSAEGDHLAIELEANPTNKSSQGQEADKAVACSKAEAADVVSAKLLQDVEEEQQQEKENCDPCTRRALCPMNCLEPKCRMHLTSTLLLILSFFLFADQQLVAPNLSQIASEFNLTDEERDLILGGLVPLCFFAIGTPITIFIGPIIDRAHRRNLFVFLIFMGEIPCLCTQWVYSPAALLVTRAITGISMAGAEPLIFSMLSDMYGVKERNVMASVITIGQGAGLLAGQALAGFLGPTSGWRLPFLCVSIPSMAFSILMLCLVEEPLRGAGEESVREATAAAKNSGKEEDGTIYKSDLTCSKVCAIFRVPTNLLLYFSEIPSSMGWGVLFAFLTDFVATDKEFGVQNATTCVAILGVGLAIGAVAGGITGQYLNNNCAFKGSVAVMIGTTALLGPLPYYWVIYAPFYCEHDVDACLADADVDPTISPTDELYISTVNDCVDTTSHTVCPTHICAKRSDSSGDTGGGTRVHDNVVSQLLTKIDGMEQQSNLLVIGITNRKDLIDEAILRPGRLEVHIEIGLPSEKERLEILMVHTNKLRAHKNLLADDVNLPSIARQMECFSGAEIEAVVIDALAFALERAGTAHTDLDVYNALGSGSHGYSTTSEMTLADIQLRALDFERAISTAEPNFGSSLRLGRNITSCDSEDCGVQQFDRWIAPESIPSMQHMRHMHWLDRSRVNKEYDAVFRRLSKLVAAAAATIQTSMAQISNGLPGIEEPPASIVLHGRPGSGRQSLLRHILSESAFFHDSKALSTSETDKLVPFAREVGPGVSVGKTDAEVASYIMDVFQKARQSPCAVLMFPDLDILLQAQHWEKEGIVGGNPEQLSMAHPVSLMHANRATTSFFANLHITQKGSSGVVILATCSNKTSLPTHLFDAEGVMPDLMWPAEAASILQCHGMSVNFNGETRNHNIVHEDCTWPITNAGEKPTLRKLVQTGRFCSHTDSSNGMHVLKLDSVLEFISATQQPGFK